MKKYLSLLLGAATVASASAAITVDKQDLTHALIYSGHCEIDINNDGTCDERPSPIVRIVYFTCLQEDQVMKIIDRQKLFR